MCCQASLDYFPFFPRVPSNLSPSHPRGTICCLSTFACPPPSFSEIVLIVKRLVKRESINVQFDLPGGNRDYDIKAGSNLRGEMIRLDVPVRAADEVRPSAPS